MAGGSEKSLLKFPKEIIPHTSPRLRKIECWRQTLCWVIISMNLLPREYMPFPNCSVTTPSPLHASSAQDWAAATPVPRIKEGPDSKIQSFQGFTLCLPLSSDSYKIQLGKAKLSWMLPFIFNLYRHTHIDLQTHSKPHQTSKGSTHTSWGGFC